MSLQVAFDHIQTSIITKAKIRACNKKIKSLRKQLAKSPLTLSIDEIKKKRTDLQTSYDALQEELLLQWPEGRETISLNNSMVKPFGLIDVTIQNKVDLNLKRGFIQRFDKQTPLNKVVKVFTRENGHLVPVYKRRKQNSGTKRTPKAAESSSSDDDDEPHPLVLAAMGQARQPVQEEEEEAHGEGDE
jgi:hypothetical protein